MFGTIDGQVLFVGVIQTLNEVLGLLGFDLPLYVYSELDSSSGTGPSIKKEASKLDIEK